jgi:hypothetical protein
MEYSDHFLQVHSELAPTLPVEVFADSIEPASIGLADRSEYYAPVQFFVQISKPVPGGVSGTLQLELPVHGNSGWLADLKTRIGRIMNNNVNVDSVRTVDGTLLETYAPDDLPTVGRLYVHNTAGSRVVLSAPPATIPREYSVHKERDVRSWVERFVQGSVSESVGRVLAAKAPAVHELEAAVRVGGAVQQELERCVRAHEPEWERFVSAHHVLPDGKRDPQQVMQRATGIMLEHIREHLRASSRAVQEHVAHVTAQLAGAETLFVSAPTGKNAVATSGPRLFQRIVDDALTMPTLEHELVGAVYSERGPHKPLPQPPRLVDARVTNAALAHHPMNAQLHHTLLPLRGAYPSYYIARHTRHDMSAQAPYPSANVMDTYRAYHKFARMHPVPPALKVARRNGVLVALPTTTIEARMRSRLVECEGNTSSSDEEKEEMVMGELPTFVPIACRHCGDAGACGCGSKRHNRRHRSQERESVKAALPPLRPVGAALPPLRPLGTEFPRLVPIECEDCDKSPCICTALPTLAPIGCHNCGRSSSSCGCKKEKKKEKKHVGAAASDGSDSEDYDFSRLPKVSDIFA